MTSPALVMILGALVVPALRGRARGAWMLALPVVVLVLLWTTSEGVYGAFDLLGLALEPVRIDGLSRVFATAFCIAAVLGGIYALHLRDTAQHVAMLVYGGAAIGGVLAGDLVTLFVFWELAGLSSVVLVLAARTERSTRAGVRYLVAQVVSGLLLLGGVVVHAQASGSIRFEHIGLDAPGGPLILLGIGIKCAFPVLHAWLPDTYPEATPVGTVVLSAFTTKMAVYTLARGFEGTEALVWIGVAMTCFPIFYAVIENDLRKVLSYSMINQLGFMVAGVGIGGALGVNGAAAHAFADIIFKGLLFMSMGAVLTQVGTVKGSELGGLFRSMPQTAAFCMVGAASISALPLFSGFVTKSMILQAAAQEHRTAVWVLLLFASAGVFHHAGIKIPFFAFFAHDGGHRVGEAPLNMRIAMALAAALCIGIGVAPGLLYDILPFPVDYQPYTTAHVVNQLQLLGFAAMAFTVLMRSGLYPPELRSVNLDADVAYRRLLPAAWTATRRGVELADARLAGPIRSRVRALAVRAGGELRDGQAGTTWSTGTTVVLVVFGLGLVLLIGLR